MPVAASNGPARMCQCAGMSDPDLRALLSTLDPRARDDLRRVMIHDQVDRDAIASQLLRYRDGRGDDWADIIDMLTMHPEARRQVVRVLAEIEARDASWDCLNPPLFAWRLGGTHGEPSCSTSMRASPAQTLRSAFDWMSNPNMRRALGWVGSMGVVAALALSFLAAPASAKGASKIVIEGPGLVHPITVEPGESTSTDRLWPLMMDSRFFLGLCHGRCGSRSRLARRPSQGLGPRYTLTYTMNLDVTSHEVVQYVFPYARPNPVTYMPAHQTFLEHHKTGGGWFITPQRMERELITLGLPATAAEATAPSPTLIPRAGQHGSPVLWAALAVVAVAFVVGMWVLFGSLKRWRSPEALSTETRQPEAQLSGRRPVLHQH
jgi:hypothetical protein